MADTVCPSPSQPVFVPLFKLYRIYGKVFKLSFGPKQFVIVSDPDMAKHVRTGAGVLVALRF